ncbi:hypothetical protein PVK06_031484 [Gossypium arboreum]|uniref:Uncharacterized protein n=1 Tax=Gossypium arboreum TaxID=29729 RepID=A0ABR0NRE1_GOSAR|nr:hypothetical protein PVK06_031484 [Gossypium arboreum]
MTLAYRISSLQNFSLLKIEMVYPNENFPINFFAGQPRDSSVSNQSSKMNLFASWFADRPKNLGNSAHVGSLNSLDLNVPSGQGLSFSSDQEASPHQFVVLQEQLRLMRVQMAIDMYEDGSRMYAKSWQNEMDALCRDVQALHRDPQDMD